MTPEAAYRKAARRLKAKYILGYLAFVCLAILTSVIIVGATGGSLPGYRPSPEHHDLLWVTFWGTLMAGLVLTLILGPILAAAKFFAQHHDGRLELTQADVERYRARDAHPQPGERAEARPEEGHKSGA